MRSILFLFIFPLLFSSLWADCTVDDPSKVDCGYVGVTQSLCEGKGCCWVPGAQGSSTPWCFYPAGHTDVCSSLSFTATSPGFTDADFATMSNYFYANLNIQGKGGVVASPDTNTPGGSYYYAWARDAALSMKSFMFINDFTYSKIQTNMDAYVQWVLRVQGESDPNNIDVRIEPKFNLPNGDPYTGGWCRPQTDGPGLRATTLSLYADVLIAAGRTDLVKQYLWTGSSSYNGGAVKHDLDWVVANWQQNGCDLWEEVQSSDFFWGRLNFRRGLLKGAALAEKMGDSATAATYRATAANIQNALSSHWTGTFVKESDNRQMDGAVVSAFNEAFNDDDYFKPTDAQVAQTVTTLNSLFCHQFQINQVDTTNGIPGVMYGRYQGDSYAGGNPWILLTADLAKLFYRGSLSILEARAAGKTVVADADYAAWIAALNLPAGSLNTEFLGTNKDLNLANAMLAAGDAVMSRIYYHVKGDGFHLAEQIDRSTGVQKSAKDLSWSYACTLVALKYRAQVAAKLTGYATA